MTVYYNEIDPYAAEWLRNLIRAGLIAPGDVDERSIEDVSPDDLRGYAQCHFFAGIGVWSHALRSAGWPDSLPVWTGSCPCQPFSAAGKGGGFADERHLWPAFFHLIRECRPARILGEQVASKDGYGWLDLIQADLEGVGYACGAVVSPAAGYGAPHERHRQYWLAHALPTGRAEGRAGAGNGPAAGGDRVGRLADAKIGGGGALDREPGSGVQPQEPLGRCDIPGGMADADRAGLGVEPQRHRQSLARREACEPRPDDAGRGDLRGLADAAGEGRRPEWADGHAGDGDQAFRAGSAESRRRGAACRPGPTNGFWRDADWLGCRDAKWRPVEARPQPLADGAAESLGRVRPEIVAALKEEISALAVEAKSSGAALVRDVRRALEKEAPRVWSSGGLPGLHEAPFLLAFLRQLAQQGRRVSKDDALPRAETPRSGMRGVRSDDAVAGAPHQRGLDRQPPREHSDAVHTLPPLLARYAQAAWGDAYRTYAEIGFPLGHDSVSRVGRLRAYGNAIVAPQAQAFVEAAQDILWPAVDLRLDEDIFS